MKKRPDPLYFVRITQKQIGASVTKLVQEFQIFWNLKRAWFQKLTKWCSHGFSWFYTFSRPQGSFFSFFSFLVSFLMLILPLSLSPSSFLLVAVQYQCTIPLLYLSLLDVVPALSLSCARRPQVVQKSSSGRTDHVLKLAGSRTARKRRTGGRNGTRQPPVPDTVPLSMKSSTMP